MSTISPSMIVKNEEKTLERCLRSIKGIADEIIIISWPGSICPTTRVSRQTYVFSKAR
jgi:predicted P-loop ATPase/GTPase